MEKIEKITIDNYEQVMNECAESTEQGEIENDVLYDCFEGKVAQVGGTHIVEMLSKTHHAFDHEYWEYLVVVKNIKTGKVASKIGVQESAEDSAYYTTLVAYENACKACGVTPCTD